MVERDVSDTTITLQGDTYLDKTAQAMEDQTTRCSFVTHAISLTNWRKTIYAEQVRQFSPELNIPMTTLP